MQNGFHLIADKFFLRVEVIGPAWRFRTRRCILQRLVDGGYVKTENSSENGSVYSLTKLGKEIKVKVPAEADVKQARELVFQY